jgi:hypothetical protein
MIMSFLAASLLSFSANATSSLATFSSTRCYLDFLQHGAVALVA